MLNHCKKYIYTCKTLGLLGPESEHFSLIVQNICGDAEVEPVYSDMLSALRYGNCGKASLFSKQTNNCF